MKFLGVDGGGTSTEFILINKKGNILGHVRKPTCHYMQTSLENFRNVIDEGVRDVCKQVNINISDIDYSYLGVPGYGEIAEDIGKIEKIVGETLSSKNYRCGNDSEVAWAGSLGCRAGINIVAGTGAIGYAVDDLGNTARSSGWGHFCGDEGSAYWLGKKLIEMFTKQSDGRANKTYLYRCVKSELDIKDDFDLLDIILNELNTERNKIAKLAKILYKAAEKGDEVAKKIYADAAYEHYLVIKALADKLNFTNKEILVSYSGGVFKAKEYVLEPLKEYLDKEDKNIKLINPILSPIAGAALYALKIRLGKIEDEIIDRLKKEEKTI